MQIIALALSQFLS